MKTTLYSPDIECDSCIKVLSRALSKDKRISSYEIQQDRLVIEHDKKVKKTELMRIIKDKGYRVALNPEFRMRIRDRAREFLSDKQKYKIEYRGLKYVILTFLLFVLFEYGVVTLLNVDISTYGWWIFYLALSIPSLGGALWHFKAYKATVTCMTGMMIGMTIGMQTGMLVGSIIGITNGFFVGALTGILLASAVGAYAGNCCGIMGLLEGIMAGIMGGTMGAMITTMMFASPLLWFMPVFVGLNLIVLIGFSHMLFEELVEGKNVTALPMSFPTFFLGCFIVLAILTAIMFFAPPSVYIR